MAFINLLKNHSQRFSAFVVCAVGIARMVPEVWCLHMYKKKLELHQDSTPVQLPVKIKDLCQQVLDQIQLHPQHEAVVVIFQTSSPNIISKGGVHNVMGGIIGLPVSFNDDDSNDTDTLAAVTNKEITLKNSEIEQTSNKIIPLSDNAKKFAVAREIYGLTTHHIWVENAIGLLCYFLAYWAGHAVNLRGGLKRWGRITFYFTSAAAAITSCLVLVGRYHKTRQRKIHDQVANLGRDYIEGGVEFYGKSAEYERDLVHEPDNLYCTLENRIASLWHLPLSERLELVKRYKI